MLSTFTWFARARQPFTVKIKAARLSDEQCDAVAEQIVADILAGGYKGRRRSQTVVQGPENLISSNSGSNPDSKEEPKE